jgi:hypothetical protein
VLGFRSTKCRWNRWVAWIVLYLFGISNGKNNETCDDIEKQFNEAEEYIKTFPFSIENNDVDSHSQAVYTSRLLNPYTKNLSKYYNLYNNSVEITDFTKYI